MSKFYFKFIPDNLRPDYNILAFVRQSDDTSIGWINSAGEMVFDFGKVQARDYPIVLRMIKSVLPIYRELLKIENYE